jgi:formyltetrahydrofolate synthetase
MDIKCRASGLLPDAAVLVCTVRAIKMHSGRYSVAAGKPLDPALQREDLEAVELGAANLVKQIENVRQWGVPVVVVINRFTTDSAREMERLREISLAAGAADCQVSDMWARGGAGGAELAQAVAAAADGARANGQDRPRFLYPLDTPIKEKIELVATRMFGADGVDYLPRAEREIKQYAEQGLSTLPICIAKTPLSLTDDPKVKGRPTGFRITIREVRAYTGAGFLCPIAGEINTMPGLPKSSAVRSIDIDEDGQIVGLF